MSKTLRLIAYNRVSTEEQAFGGYNLGQYEELIRRHCEYKEWVLGEKDIYTDPGISGRTTKRPAYQAMVARLQNDPEIDGLIVAKLDRLHRNTIDSLTFAGKMEEWGKNFVCLNPPIDLTTPEGKMMLGFFSALDQYESDRLSYRVKLAKAKARALGIHPSVKDGRFWEVEWNRPEALKVGGSGVFVPKPSLIEVWEGRQKKPAVSWFDLGRKFSASQGCVRKNYKSYLDWLSNPIAGFIVSGRSRIEGQPQTLKRSGRKDFAEKRKKGRRIVANEQRRVSEGKPLLYPTKPKLAKAIGIARSVLYNWNRDSVVDLSYMP
jgi:DNA invertase Pin-like site-specific DNA recombinase